MRLTAAALCLSALPAAAQDPAEGAALFAFHCAMCHGAEAKGNGPEAPSLNPQPKDLTLLAAENGGTFPTLMVVKRIDGREAIVAHGSPMPVFGEYFEGPAVERQAETGEAMTMTKPVADLVAWLMSVQAK
ncbi:MAG: c-type cytochrome [Paracoccaceae bacterium]